MSENVTITIIIPTHNRRSLLEETVASVVQQTYDNWELYIIDDCSNDDTWEWLKKNINEKIHALRMERNVERSRARNIGLGKASGEYVLFLDDDDLLAEHALQSLVLPFKRFPTAIACIGGYLTFDEKGNEKSYKIVSNTFCINIFKDFLFGEVATSGHSLFKTRAFKQAGGWNEQSSFAEDHELWFQIAVNTKVILIPELTLKYRVHGQWRPDNQHQIMTHLRYDAVKRLPENKRNWGLKILKARELLPEAEALYANGQMFKAFFVYFKIAYYAPSLLASPLSSKITFLPLIKCLLTSYGINAGKKIAAKLRSEK